MTTINNHDQSDKFKELELIYKLSDNYKLELEKEIRIKELELEI